MQDFPNFFGLEWTPGAVGIWVFGFSWLSTQVLKFLEQRRLNRKLSLEDKVAARDGFAAQVTHLTAENRDLRRELFETRSEHRTERIADREEFAAYRQLCETETNQLRHQVNELHNEVVAYRRARAAEQRGTARLLSNGVDAPASVEALDRLEGK